MRRSSPQGCKIVAGGRQTTGSRLSNQSTPWRGARLGFLAPLQGADADLHGYRRSPLRFDLRLLSFNPD